MSSSWHQKKEKLRKEQEARDEAAIPDESFVKDQTSAAAMGGGDAEIFEKKLSKEEKKALAKAKRETKKKEKGKGTNGDEDEVSISKADMAMDILKNAQEGLMATKDLSISNELADALASEGTICTFASSRKGVDARSRDINIQNFTLQHKGMVMLDQSEIVLNHGNRYGIIGRNGCVSAMCHCISYIISISHYDDTGTHVANYLL